MNKETSILFLNLKTFSATGGIEKVCRIAGKALDEISLENNWQFFVYSLHDHNVEAKNNKYYPTKIFKGFGSSKINFILRSIISKKKKANIVILSHINLLLVGCLVKFFSPRTKLVLFAHGIEIWDRKPFIKRILLNQCDKILSVSSFTKKKIEENNYIPENKIVILNNSLDPNLPPKGYVSKQELLNRYSLGTDDVILLAVTRYSNKEQYKGYDIIIEIMNDLIKAFPNIRYVLVGKYDSQEYIRIKQLVKKYNLIDRIILTGFVKDEELGDHFEMSDLFVMPSEREGFGIVFIESLYYGLPVVAGNQDGSNDALMNGQLGILVNPKNKEEIVKGIIKGLTEPIIKDYELLIANFGFPSYTKKLFHILESLLK